MAILIWAAELQGQTVCSRGVAEQGTPCEPLSRAGADLLPERGEIKRFLGVFT